MACPGCSRRTCKPLSASGRRLLGEQRIDSSYLTSAWLLTQANLSAKTLQTLDPFITGSSQVYRVQSVGYFDSSSPASRIEAVFDTNAGRPRIVYWRDLTELGKGYTKRELTSE